VRVTRDLDRAEECVQEAFAAALTDWGRSGIPSRPGAWLTTTARRRALNVLRHQGVEARYLPLLVEEDTVAGPEASIGEEDGTPIPTTGCGSS
jgi:RNA polymerase sigma-70 factor (ECF subfamily)